MERRLTEEQVTKTIMAWLSATGWEIVCFDFPQSGTGTVLHLNRELSASKNKGSVIPDIVAYKEQCVVFFENKDRFVYDDFVKVNHLRTTADYSDAIAELLVGYEYDRIAYGVGLLQTKGVLKRVKEHEACIDFALLVDKDQRVEVCLDKENVFVSVL